MASQAERDPVFEEWKREAGDADLLATAQRFGATLRRGGAEYVGPCPSCGGRDRFGVNPSKGKWICRGAGGGGDAIGLAMHVAGLSFLQAVEELTGRPPPNGRATEMSPEDRAARDRAKAARDAAAQAERRKREQQRELKAADAAEIWHRQVRPIVGTLAERYLVDRGIPVPPNGWPNESIGFHPGLTYRLEPPYPRFPALVGRIQDVAGETVAVHAVFLNAHGKKLDRDPPKLTYGPLAGGSIRLGGPARRVNACEGLETGFGICWLIGFREPVWPTLGTAGLADLEVPLDVSHVAAWPDGDAAMKRQGNEFVVTDRGAGLTAAFKLRERMRSAGIGFSMNEPPHNADFLDVWNAVRRSEAESE